jgi:tetratricopeptide (TPR) repeat protein
MKPFEFEITIQRKSDDYWPMVVRVKNLDGLTTQAKGRFQLSEDDFQELTEAQDNEKEYGTLLGKQLFREDVRETFIRNLSKSSQDCPLRIMLSNETDDKDELRKLHWERLCAPIDADGTWNLLARDQRVPYSQYISTIIDRPFPPIGRNDLRALVLVASPSNLGKYQLDPFDVEAAVSSVRGALGEIPCAVLANNIDGAIGPPTLEELSKQLTNAQEPYTLLHFVCHGRVLPDGETALYWAKEDNQLKQVTGTQLLEELGYIGGQRHLPHFAFLCTCESAAPRAEGAFGGLAQRLVRDLGMPAVVAMTRKVSVQTALALGQNFYRRLRVSGKVDVALQEATAGLGNRSDITVPALFSRLGGTPLFSNLLATESIPANLPRSQKPRLPNVLPPFSNVTLSRNGFFTGRESILDKLHQALQGSNATAINQPQALSGLGGVGKTQTAVEYAYRFSHEYEAVFWVKAETESDLVSGFVEIARLLNLPLKNAKDENETIEAVRRWLEQNGSWLLLFDNADDPSILKSFLPRNWTGHILLTSRAQNFDVLGIARPIPIKEMLPEEALAFLLKRIGREDASEEERHCAQELVTELGYLALAIEQAGAYIAAKQVTISAYLNSYQNRKLQVLEKGQPQTGDYPESVATTWLINFEQVKAASEAAADVLRFSAFLSPDNIPLELLILGRTVLTPAIQEALGDGEDELAIDELLAPLTCYSLIRKAVDSQSYSIHRLVQEVFKDTLDGDKRKQWSERVVRAVQKAFPEIEYTTWVFCELILAQAEAAYRIIEKFKFEFEEAGDLLNQTGYYLNERARYDKAEPLYERALAIWEKVLGPEHPNVASSLNNLAELYRNQGRYEEAEPLYERALAIREKVLGPEHPSVAQSLDNLAGLYRKQGRYEEAEPLLKRALAIQEKVLGPKHSDVATSLNDLAALYFSQGRYEEAESLCKRALAIWEKVLGPEHPNVATSLDNLAGLYLDQCHYEKAEPLYERALAIWEKVLGPEHPNVAISLNSLAVLYFSQGRYEKAGPLFKRALAIYEKVLGPEHPNTFAVRQNYTDCLKRNRKKKKGFGSI